MRPDIPDDLRARALAIDPALAAWLETAYPTDAEHERRRQRGKRQLVLPLTSRPSAPASSAESAPSRWSRSNATAARSPGTARGVSTGKATT